MKKIAIYCRVSTSEQTTENQRIRLIEYCNKNNIQYDIFDEVQSTRKTRPVKADLMQKLRQQLYCGVLVYKIDRFARSSTELILDVKEILDKNLMFISLSDNLDFTTATGQLHFQILGAFAQFERSLISERTREGIKRAKLQGKQLGRPKGSKDSKQRKKSGYYLREINKRKKTDENSGLYKNLSEY